MARVSGARTLFYSRGEKSSEKSLTITLPPSIPHSCLTFDEDSQKENSRKCEAEQLQHNRDVAMAQVPCRREGGSSITAVSLTRYDTSILFPGLWLQPPRDPLYLCFSFHFPKIQDFFLTQPFRN